MVALKEMMTRHLKLVWWCAMFQWFWSSGMCDSTVPETSSVAPTSTMFSLTNETVWPVRAFIIATFPGRGCLILGGHKKKKGGNYYQLPGGRVDSSDVTEALGRDQPKSWKDFELIARKAAVRELREETGIHIEDEKRLVNLLPRGIGTLSVYFFALELKITDSYEVQGPSVCEVKSIWITDSTDLTSMSSSLCRFKAGPLRNAADPEHCARRGNPPFFVKLSNEHHISYFVDSYTTAAELVKSHSKGRSREALLRFAAL